MAVQDLRGLRDLGRENWNSGRSENLPALVRSLPGCFRRSLLREDPLGSSPPCSAVVSFGGLGQSGCLGLSFVPASLRSPVAKGPHCPLGQGLGQGLATCFRAFLTRTVFSLPVCRWVPCVQFPAELADLGNRGTLVASVRRRRPLGLCRFRSLGRFAWGPELPSAVPV